MFDNSTSMTVQSVLKKHLRSFKVVLKMNEGSCMHLNFLSVRRCENNDILQ